MIRVSGYCVGSSDHTYQSRQRLPAGDFTARRNQGCWSEVWLITSSVMTRRSRLWASRTNRLKSRTLPYIGLTVS